MKKLLIAAAISATVSISPAAYADYPLIAAADLPGIPLSVTDPARRPVPATNPQPVQASPQYVSSVVDADQVNTPEQAIQQIQAELAAEMSRKKPGDGDYTAPGGKLLLEPGVNKIISISRGHPNRILLPFDDPDIHTTSTDALIKAESSVIVVATNSKLPVTLFISPKDNPRLALSLTLAPQTMPPAQYEVSISASLPEQYAFKNTKADQWERKDDYTRVLVNLFDKLAKQDLPQGYSLKTPEPGDLHSCFKPNSEIEWELAQVIQGHHIMVDVVVAKNNGNIPVEIIGSDCNGLGVIAAAEWPRSVLEPGEVTEVFVASQRSTAKAQRIRRPSAIRGFNGQN